MKAWMKARMPYTQKLTQKYQQGMMFYEMLKLENDSHYAGGGREAGHARSAHLLVQAHRRPRSTA